MPEVRFQVRWPDASVCEYYSPSTSIHDHLRAGEEYTVAEFVERSRSALHRAAERVRAKFGFYCSSAMDTLQQIEATATAYADQPSATVKVLALRPRPGDG